MKPLSMTSAEWKVVLKEWGSTMKRVKKAIQCEHLKYSGENPAITIWCEKKKKIMKVDRCAYCWKFYMKKKRGVDNFL